jgi:hypothetical protein
MSSQQQQSTDHGQDENQSGEKFSFARMALGYHLASTRTLLSSSILAEASVSLLDNARTNDTIRQQLHICVLRRTLLISNTLLLSFSENRVVFSTKSANVSCMDALQ